MNDIFIQRSAIRIALLLLAGYTLSAPAFQPLFTDDTGTQGSGGNQLEFSLNHDRAKAGGDVERLSTHPVVYARGLGDALDVFAGFSHARIRSSAPAGDASGGGNPTFGAKWRFYESARGKTSFAIKPEILFPVSTEREATGLGNGKTSGAVTVIFTQELSFGAIHLNAGLVRDRYRDASTHPDTTTTRASFAPVWNLTERWKLALDLGTESAHAAGASVRSNFMEIGAIYSPRKDLDFALGILRSSDNDAPRTTANTATAGITWRFR